MRHLFGLCVRHDDDDVKDVSAEETSGAPQESAEQDASDPGDQD